MYDIKIKNGMIVNGAGTPGFVGGVGIRAGKIAAVGHAPEDALREIDATGLVVCPGFIDVHTHYDAQYFWDRTLSPSSWYGVTTVVMGNCGFALAPTKAEDRRFILETLQHVEGIPFECSWPAMGDGEWGYETFPEFLDMLDRRGCALNVVAQIGHTALRTWVMGPEAASSRVATDQELAEMCRIAREALDAGAAGISTSSTPAHFGAGGRPVPSRYADEREHMALAQAITDAGHGVWQGNWGTVLHPEFLLDVLEATGVPMSEINPGVQDAGIISDLRDLGYECYSQMGIVPNYIYTGLHEPFMFALDQPGGVFMVPRLAELFDPLMDMTERERLEAYKAPEFLPKFIADSDNDSWNNGYWPSIVIAVAPTHPDWEGRMIVDVAAEQGCKPAEILWQISVESDLEARINILSAKRDMKYLMEPGQDFVTPGLHDAGAHLSQIAESRWPLNLMGSYARERGVPIEWAVYMATYQCAKAFRILERGLLLQGWQADVVVFDPATIIDGNIREYADLPGDAKRLMAEPFGVEHVIVNGVVVREHNKDVIDSNGPWPGEVLRHFAPHSGRPRQPVPQSLRERVQAVTDKQRKYNAGRRAGGEAPTDPAQPGREVVW